MPCFISFAIKLTFFLAATAGYTKKMFSIHILPDLVVSGVIGRKSDIRFGKRVLRPGNPVTVESQAAKRKTPREQVNMNVKVLYITAVSKA